VFLDIKDRPKFPGFKGQNAKDRRAT